LDTGQLIRTFQGHTATVRCFAIAPNGRTVATGSADKTVRLWDLKSGNELHQFKDNTAAIAAVAFSPDSKLMASAGGEDGTIRLWDVIESVHPRAIRTLRLSRDAERLVVLGYGLADPE
jgi:WD40 repeat protein